MNLLMLHGNGGAGARFQLFLEALHKSDAEINPVIPQLPGFEGRPLPKSGDYWSLFLKAIEDAIIDKLHEPWVFYGHGIGGSILLEWAARDWLMTNGQSILPKQVILHGCIGASLEHRLFPKLMKPFLLRKFIHWLIYQPWLRRRWERKLFLFPDRIPGAVRHQFFEDYRRCDAFTVLFDLINANWYRAVQKRVGEKAFYFLWGEKERVVAAKHLQYWRKDFPKATFDIVPEWDHFPMLDQPEAFCDYLTQKVLGYE